MPAHITTYIKVDDEGKGLSDFLFNGSIGSLLSNATGGLILGNHYEEVYAQNSLRTNIASGRTDNLTSSEALKVVINKKGDTFIAITPHVAYKSVVIKDVTNALLVGTSNFVHLLHAFYFNPESIACDSEGAFTSFDKS